MRCRSLAAVALVVAVASLPPAAGAALIEVVSVTRSVTASADHSGPGSGGAPNSNTATSSSPAGTIQASAHSSNPSFPQHFTSASNRQTSTILANEIQAGGSGDAFATEFMFGFGGYAMEFSYDITFQVTEPTRFDFFGYANFGYFPSFVSATLWNADDVVVFDESRTNAGSAVLSETGLVDAGQHRLLITLLRSGSTVEEPGFTGYQMSSSLRFTAIPEPGTAALVALGLCALARRRCNFS